MPRTIEEFITAHEIRMDFTKVPANPNMSDDEKWSREASHWHCRFEYGLPGRNDNTKPGRFVTYFSQGSAHKKAPTAADVLDSLASDASSVDLYGQSFEDWAADMGWDTDSRKAEDTYRLILKQSRKLKTFLGLSAFKELLEEIERL